MDEGAPITEAEATGNTEPLIGPPIPEDTTNETSSSDPDAESTGSAPDTESLPTEMTENDMLRTEAEEAIKDLGSKSLQKQIDIWTPVIKLNSEEQMKMPHLVSVRKLSALRFYMYEDPAEVDEKEDGVKGVAISEKPMIIPSGKKTYSITRLQAQSTDGATITCQANELDAAGNPVKNPDGSILVSEIQIPRADIINNQIISEQEELRGLLPPEEQLVFDQYVQLLEGNSLPEDISPSDLAKIQKIAADAQESLSTTEENAENMLLLEASGASYPVTDEAGTIIYYTKEYGDKFKELVEANLKAAEERKGSALTDFDKKLVQMQTVREIQQKNKRDQPMTNDMEHTLEIHMQNYLLEYKHATSEEIAAEKEKFRDILKFRQGNAKDIDVLFNKDKMAELQKKLSKKELAAFFALMMGLLGKDFVKDFMPQGH